MKQKNMLNEILSLMDRIDKPRTGWEYLTEEFDMKKFMEEHPELRNSISDFDSLNSSNTSEQPSTSTPAPEKPNNTVEPNIIEPQNDDAENNVTDLDKVFVGICPECGGDVYRGSIEIPGGMHRIANVCSNCEKIVKVSNDNKDFEMKKKNAVSYFKNMVLDNPEVAKTLMIKYRPCVSNDEPKGKYKQTNYNGLVDIYGKDEAALMFGKFAAKAFCGNNLNGGGDMSLFRNRRFRVTNGETSGFTLPFKRRASKKYGMSFQVQIYDSLEKNPKWWQLAEKYFF